MNRQSGTERSAAGRSGTDDLIRALSKQAGAVGPRPQPRLALGLGLLAAFAAVLAVPGPRPDLFAALAGAGGVLKAAACALPLMVAGALLPALARPETVRFPRGALPALAACLAVALLYALAFRDPGGRLPRVPDGLTCTISVLVLALPAFLAVFAALRRSAPANPARAGACAGLAAASAGAVAYNLACPLSEGFAVLLHYGIAFALAGLAGAGAGRLFLRW